MIRLHAVPGSRSFRVHWMLAEIGIEPDEVVNYRIGDGSLGAEDYRGVNPAGRVPSLEIDGRTMIESGAIVEYLCETRGTSFWRAPGDAERADWLQYLHYAETVAGLIQNLNLQQVFLPDPAMRSPTVIGLEVRRLATVLKPLEARLREQEFMMSSGFSGVDVMYGFAIEAAFHYVHREKFPALVAYGERLAARPAFQTAMAAQGPDTIYRKAFYEVPDG
ncbi:glutathione S-transferase family protein [Maritimibacter dapengensis]|uniref:Glutathione S-transferase family protein n=1 Tax=Maritimibacter dapengensis TaxID=2836868 RepID=A0ABS6T317_9RHOB|nr:glutathione S-transferase family protein [Maritimibacter dapengensis]MBV7379098.1 glutathione S-transferase family protein [Maritimibacter dapengensis]